MRGRPRASAARNEYVEGEMVEIRYLPGQKKWERATYVRRVRADEMPSLWKGPLGHVVQLNRYGDNRRCVQITCQRIRKFNQPTGNGTRDMKIKWTNHHVRKSAIIYFGAFMQACCKLRIASPRAALIDTDEFPKLRKVPDVEFSIGWLHACAEAHGIPITALYDQLFDELAEALNANGVTRRAG